MMSTLDTPVVLLNVVPVDSPPHFLTSDWAYLSEEDEGYKSGRESLQLQTFQTRNINTQREDEKKTRFILQHPLPASLPASRSSVVFVGPSHSTEWVVLQCTSRVSFLVPRYDRY